VELDDGNFMVLGNNLYKVEANGNYSVINNNVSYQIDNNFESSSRIQKTQDGNYLIGSGDKWNSTQNKLSKVDANGNELWQISMTNENFHLVSSSILENGDYIALGENQVFKFTRDDYNPALEGIYLQIGANTDQGMRISIDSMKPGDLGFTNGLPSVIPRDNASLSLAAVDLSISKVGLSRSKLGAAQNTLEHIISNVSNTSENLTNSESKIRDTDMAREVVQFSKNNLLMQASQAMLANANQMPKGMLELLK
jgi:flagellin